MLWILGYIDIYRNFVRNRHPAALAIMLGWVACNCAYAVSLIAVTGEIVMGCLVLFAWLCGLPAVIYLIDKPRRRNG